MAHEANQLLIPVHSWKSGIGRYSLPATLHCSAPLLSTTYPLARLKKACTNQRIRVRFNQGVDPHAHVQCLLRKHPGPEGYEIHIQADGIKIYARDDRGWFYGLHTLTDLLNLSSGTLAIGVIKDSPQLKRRGIYLDCSRGKVPTLDTLRDLIQQLSAWKINELQLYIENTFTFRKHPSISKGFSPFTPDDMLTLQDLCREHHIRFVPSLSSFGHFERTLSLPEYSDIGEHPGNWGFPGGTTLCPTDKRSIALVADMYEEFLPLFDAHDFNACCDEPWELGKGRSLKAAQRKGVDQVYLAFILKLHRLCEKHGKRMNIWGDIVLNHPEIIKEIPTDVVMLNWDYIPNGARMPRTRELSGAGLPVMICPGTHGWGSHGSRIDQAFPNVADFSTIGKAEHVEGMLMTDWGDFGHRNPLGVSMPAYAWAAAHAWGRPGSPNSFLKRYCQATLPDQAATLHQIIQGLGNVERSLGLGVPYYSFAESLHGGFSISNSISSRYPAYLTPPAQRPYIQTPRKAALARTIEKLEALPSISPVRACSPWVRETVNDLKTAHMLDLCATKRIRMAQSIRSGVSPSSLEKKTVRRDLNSLQAAFSKNWEARNRPSRLGDNLQIFSACIQEIDAL